MLYSTRSTLLRASTPRHHNYALSTNPRDPPSARGHAARVEARERARHVRGDEEGAVLIEVGVCVRVRARARARARGLGLGLGFGFG